MKCKQVEKIIVEEFQSDLDKTIKLKLEDHLSGCSNCMSFKENYYSLRLRVKKIETPSPSEEVTEQTKTLCYDEFLRQKEIILFADQKRQENETPLMVWFAFLVLLGLTLIWAFPVLKDYVEEQLVTKHTIYLVMIVVQNILALIYAPVLFRIFKVKKLSINYF